MRLLNYVMLAAFVLGVAVQYNDPDPWPWIVIYSAAAVACLSFARGWMLRRLPVAVGLVALVWAATLVPDVLGHVGFGELFESIEMKGPEVEAGREMGGLLIITAWMGVLTWTARKSEFQISKTEKG